MKEKFTFLSVIYCIIYYYIIKYVFTIYPKLMLLVIDIFLYHMKKICENKIEEDKLICRWNSIIFQQDCALKKKRKKEKKSLHTLFHATITFVHPFLSQWIARRACLQRPLSYILDGVTYFKHTEHKKMTRCHIETKW